MSGEARKLLRAVLKLSVKERAAVAQSLIRSVDEGADPGAEAAWAEEITRRVKDIDEGRTKLIPWSETRRKPLQGALWVAEPQAKTSRRCSPENVLLRFYAWSPDGAWIAFSYWRGKLGDRGSGFGIVKADGSGFREIRTVAEWPSWNPPTWSPDSRQIVCEGDGRGGPSYNLWLCTVDGAEPKRIFSGEADRPAWRPLS